MADFHTCSMGWCDNSALKDVTIPAALVKVDASKDIGNVKKQLT